jgi:phosphatidylglycerophosphate synthase
MEHRVHRVLDKPTFTAPKNRLLYVIEPGEQDPASHLAESVAVRVYGRTLLDRNIRLLLKQFDAIHVVLLVNEGAAGELQAALGEVPSSAGVTAQFVTSLDLCSVSDVDAVLLQRGIGILENITSAAGEYYCTSPSETEEHGDDRPTPIGIAWEAREAVCGSENASCMVRRQGATRGTPRQACVSTSKIRTHFLTDSDSAVASQLSSYLHAKASLRSMDGPVSRLLMRRLSRHLSRPLGRWGVHPNVVTVVAAAVALFAALLFAIGDRSALLVGGVVWFVGGVLDEVDGELARLQGKESEFGGWLDLTLDRIVDGLVLVGLAWPIAAGSSDSSLWALTALAIVLVETSSYVGLLYDSWMKSALGRTVYFRIGRDTRNLTILLFSAFSLRAAAIVFVAAISLAEIARRLVVCLLWSRATARRDRVG